VAGLRKSPVEARGHSDAGRADTSTDPCRVGSDHVRQAGITIRLRQSYFVLNSTLLLESG
jgi:hypothetical protein